MVQVQQNKLPPDYLARPSIRCSSCLPLITIRGETLQVKRPTTRLVGMTFNQGQVKRTPHKHQGRSYAKQKEAPPDGDKTFNQVEIKPEMISCHLLFTGPPRSYAYIDKALLSAPSKIPHLSSRQPIHTTTSNG